MDKHTRNTQRDTADHKIQETVDAILAGETIRQEELTLERRRKLIERLRQQDRPLLATEKAHGPG